MQFTIKDKTFDSGRLNAFQQLHVVRRLAPVTERLVALAGSAGDPEAFLGPLARTVGELPDADVDYILNACLDVTQIPLDKDRVYRNLDVGNPIIVVVGPGDFTTDGHFLVLTGHSGDKITLNDPNSPTNSAKSWDYDTLDGQIQALWVLRRAG